MQPFRNPKFVSMNLSLSVLCIDADPDLESSFIILLILVRMLLYQVSSTVPDSTPNNSALSLHSALFFCPSLNVDSVRTYNIGCPFSHLTSSWTHHRNWEVGTETTLHLLSGRTPHLKRTCPLLVFQLFFLMP